MRHWRYHIKGIRQYLNCEQEDDASLRTATTGIAEGLEKLIGELKNPPKSLTRIKDYAEWAIPEYGIEELEQIVEEMRDAGGIGDSGDKPDLEWLNNTVDAMYNWCDHFNVWVELDT